MSRCRACDSRLTPFELTRKIIHEDNKVEYLDTCSKCYNASPLPKTTNIVERYDLLHEVDITEEMEDTLEEE
jgi:hypothetical protein